MAERSPRSRQLLLVLLAAVVLGLWWWAQGPAPEAEPPAVPQATQTATTTPTSAPTPSRDVVAYDDLPAEARTTIRLIEEGGPFPYDRDGIAFGNFEGLLPQQPRGYYHEYTVRTPGTNGRGARRIVTGRDGTMYYTSDHYQSFRRIEGP